MMGTVLFALYLHTDWKPWGTLGLILASFAGWAVSLCVSGAAVQTHAKLTMARTVILYRGPLPFPPRRVERLAGVERRRLGQLPAIQEGIALVSV